MEAARKLDKGLSEPLSPRTTLSGTTFADTVDIEAQSDHNEQQNAIRVSLTKLSPIFHCYGLLSQDRYSLLASLPRRFCNEDFRG